MPISNIPDHNGDDIEDDESQNDAIEEGNDEDIDEMNAVGGSQDQELPENVTNSNETEESEPEDIWERLYAVVGSLQGYKDEDMAAREAQAPTEEDCEATNAFWQDATVPAGDISEIYLSALEYEYIHLSTQLNALMGRVREEREKLATHGTQA